MSLNVGLLGEYRSKLILSVSGHNRKVVVKLTAALFNELEGRMRQEATGITKYCKLL